MAGRKKRTRKSSPRPGGNRSRRWIVHAVLFSTGIVIGLFGPWVWWLDREAGLRFSDRQWELASRVYARPLELHAGAAVSADDVAVELEAAGLSNGSAGSPGRWSRSANSFDIHLPDFVFADGRQPSLRFELEIRNDRVSRLDAVGEPEVGLVRLPPAEIGTILPLDARDRTLVALEDFPELLVTGLQAVEDRQFRHHRGIDPRALARAAWRNLVHGEVVQGGSTLTQQLVKNLYLTPERSLLRKFNEAVMAMSLERRHSKSDILETYLNEVWMGQSGGRAIHGFGRASEHYFGLPPGALSTEQTALLVGMVRGASWYHPRRNPDRALARRNQVLDIFLQTGLIDQAEHERARNSALGVRASGGGTEAVWPAFMDLVQRQLRRDYRDSDLRETGLRVFTTLSPSAQRHAEAALTDGLYEVEQGTGAEALQGAVLLADPVSGEIRALVGDRQARRAGFNRALDARRQVGSVIKPFIYLLALADSERYNLVTPLEDTPLKVPLQGQADWEPRNHDGQPRGTVPLMDALVHSYNLATVRLGLDVGLPGLFSLLRNLGLALEPVDHPSALLGALGMTPLEVAQAYQPLAADGYSTPLRSITAVVDASGQPVGRYPLRLQPIAERQALALVNYSLEQVVRDGTAAGLSRQLGEDLPVAGKTGTTNQRRDAWFVGYTPDWLGVVWAGRDDGASAGIGGGTGAVPVWARLFRQLPASGDSRNWPEDIEWYWVDWPEAALSAEDCSGARALPFVAGSAPEARADCLGDADPPRQRRRFWRR